MNLLAAPLARSAPAPHEHAAGGPLTGAALRHGPSHAGAPLGSPLRLMASPLHAAAAAAAMGECKTEWAAASAAMGECTSLRAAAAAAAVAADTATLAGPAVTPMRASAAPLSRRASVGSPGTPGAAAAAGGGPLAVRVTAAVGAALAVLTQHMLSGAAGGGDGGMHNRMGGGGGGDARWRGLRERLLQ